MTQLTISFFIFLIFFWERYLFLKELNVCLRLCLTFWVSVRLDHLPNVAKCSSAPFCSASLLVPLAAAATRPALLSCRSVRQSHLSKKIDVQNFIIIIVCN